MFVHRRTTRHRLPSPRSRNAFTLIELLVNIAIIAILVAILLPVFKEMREKVRQITCLSNVKQMGTAIAMYAEDYDEALVPYQIYNGTGKPLNPYADNVEVSAEAKKAIFMNQLLQPYLRGDGVWQCSSRIGSWVNVEASEPVYEVARSYGGQNSYCANMYAFRGVYITGGGVVTDGQTLTMSAIANPTDTLAVVEGVGYIALPKAPCRLAGQGYNPVASRHTRFWMNIGEGLGLVKETPNDELKCLKQGAKRHNARVNCCFFDGHAKSMKYDQVVLDSPLNSRDSVWDPFKQGCQ